MTVASSFTETAVNATPAAAAYIAGFLFNRKKMHATTEKKTNTNMHGEHILTSGIYAYPALNMAAIPAQAPAEHASSDTAATTRTFCAVRIAHHIDCSNLRIHKQNVRFSFWF